ncbi:MAG TPA: hypothetical protein VND68_07440 [Chloroflexia bacterium]|jgi:hypothetical protein|nr:hypothetical protein [Chloroflexia bacterium]
MDTKTLRAHFDGQKIVLDEPFELETDTELLVTILPKEPSDEAAERKDWLELSMKRLQDAYGEDEPEYSLDMIKEPNPRYEGR